MSFQYTFRPIERWPQEPTRSPRPAHFRLTYERQLKKLSYELEQLGAETAIIQADVSDRDIRVDGALRSNSSPRSARIIVSAVTKHGPMSLPCDTYVHWKDNLYAIALSLEALRDVDRHGVTKRGEQYRGLKQLTAGEDSFLNSQEAAAWLAKRAFGLIRDMTPREILDAEVYFEQAYRAIAKVTHPDAGGTLKEWDKLQRAAAILRDHHGVSS